MADINYIETSDLEYMCKHETKYMDSKTKNICKQFLQNNEVTEDLLRYYCLKELETWGDMVKGLIVFHYKEKTITGKFNDYDTPVEIISITNAI